MNRSIWIVVLLLLSFLSFSPKVVNKLRSKAVAVLPSKPWKASHEDSSYKNLKVENYQLRMQLDLIYNWIHSEKYLSEQMAMFQKLGVDSKLAQGRIEEIKSLLQKKAMAASGRIIYRDPSSWSSTCWIDAGEENNLSLGKTIIAKNSPVISGSALVGVVEYVGRRQSRVRLITDSSLKTAVRAVRGSMAEREVALLSRMLLERLVKHPFQETLKAFQESLPIQWEDGYFAKGEISGTSAPYFRALQPVLKGIGFNCNFADEDSPSRDLRSGILQENDLLITSGLDGIFPPGLQVGRVMHVQPLRPGAYSFDLEAEPSAGDLADLTVVYVLPPVSE